MESQLGSLGIPPGWFSGLGSSQPAASGSWEGLSELLKNKQGNYHKLWAAVWHVPCSFTTFFSPGCISVGLPVRCYLLSCCCCTCGIAGHGRLTTSGLPRAPAPRSFRCCGDSGASSAAKTARVPRRTSAKTRGFHTQLDEGPETP